MMRLTAKEDAMIVEYVLFKSPPGKSREEILADAKLTVPKWRANKELVRKHYIESEDGYGGAFYIWPSREAAERGHDAAWRAGVEQRTGSTPVIRYFDLLMVVDNEAGKVTEYPADAEALASAK
jgi:hypothetical protein